MVCYSIIIGGTHKKENGQESAGYVMQNSCCGINRIGNFKGFIMKTFCLFIISIAVILSSCNNKTSSVKVDEDGNNSLQENLIKEGWVFDSPLGGDLGDEYGVKPIYGVHDNYFDITIGEGCSVAIKIMDVTSGKCIRYVYVPENETVTVTEIPQGQYFLKLAYGKDWMENDTDSITQGKFTKKAFFEKSTESYNFGKKNTGDFVNYSLKINVVDETTENNFTTVSISEDEFNKNY